MKEKKKRDIKGKIHIAHALVIKKGGGGTGGGGGCRGIQAGGSNGESQQQQQQQHESQPPLPVPVTAAAGASIDTVRDAGSDICHDQKEKGRSDTASWDTITEEDIVIPESGGSTHEEGGGGSSLGGGSQNFRIAGGGGSAASDLRPSSSSSGSSATPFFSSTMRYLSSRVLSKVSQSRFLPRLFSPSSSSSDSLGQATTSSDDDPPPPLPFGKVSIHVRQAHICNRKCSQKDGFHHIKKKASGGDGSTTGAAHHNNNNNNNNYNNYNNNNNNNNAGSNGGGSNASDQYIDMRSIVAVSFEGGSYVTSPASGYEPEFGGGGKGKPVEFDVFSYQSTILFDVVDELTSNLIGGGGVSVFSIIEKKTQHQYKKLGGMGKEMLFEGREKMGVTLGNTLKNMQNPPSDYEVREVTDMF